MAIKKQSATKVSLESHMVITICPRLEGAHPLWFIIELHHKVTLPAWALWTLGFSMQV